MALSTQKNSKRDFTGLSLCAGYGGLELGISIAEPGYRTVCYVERESHAAATLVARMEDQALDHAPVWNDVKTFDGRPWRGKVHCLTAGYPCQPFSFAGRRLGKKDPRHLWPDITRIIDETQPQICFFENVEGHVNLGAAEVIGDLRKMGFEVKAGLFSALETGAPHIRRRFFIMAYANNFTLLEQDRSGSRPKRHKISKRSNKKRTIWNSSSGKNMDNDLPDSQSNRREANGQIELPVFAPAPSDFEAWSKILARRPDLQPELFRLGDGLADRVERTRAAGNGVCSMAAAYAWQTLKAAFIGD